MSYDEQNILKDEDKQNSSSSLHNFVNALDETGLAERESIEEVGISQIGCSSAKHLSVHRDLLPSAPTPNKKFILPLPGSVNEYSANKFGLQNRTSVLRMLTGALLLWSITHLIRYSLLSAKSVTIREAAPPSPFFLNSNGFLQDFFDGGIDELQILRSRAEFTIVILYSPWDPRCQQFRRPFRQIAASFKNLPSIKFVAANCNYYRGICRRKYKLLSFPVIFAITPYGQPVVFNQALSSDRLFSWILHLLSPLHALHSIDDLHHQIRRFDFLIVGHFTLQYTKFALARAYNVFLNAAYKAADIRAQLAFGTVLNPELAAQMEFTDFGQLQFYTFYADSTETINKPVATLHIDQRTKSQEIIGWANERIRQYEANGVTELELEDLETPGKLQTLYQKINSSESTLVLFTNSLGLPGYSTASLIALKNFAKIFNYCPQSTANFSAATFSGPQFQPTKLGIYFHDLQQNCPPMNTKIIEPRNDDEKRRRKYSSRKVFFSAKFSPQPFKTNANNYWRRQMHCKFGRLIRRGYRNIFREYSAIADQSEEEFEQKMLSETNIMIDDFAKEFGWIFGAGCRLNTTLGFLVIDKRFGRHFLWKWGGDKMTTSNNVNHSAFNFIGDAAAIVLMGEERIFWMPNDHSNNINLTSMAHFISNFTNGTLEWAPANEPIIERQQWDEVEEDGKIRDRLHGFPISKLDKLNRAMFDEQILKNPNRSHDVIILFSGGDWHGPSRSVIHSYHQARHYFQEFHSPIRFCILDTSKNALPWVYNFERLPVVVFFPAGRSQESHVFSSEMALTVPNLMSFMLPRCQPKIRWKLAFSVCRTGCLTRNVQRIHAAMQTVRKEIQARWRLIGRRRRRHRYSNTFIDNVRLHTLKVHLRRRKLQRTALVRMLNLVSSILNMD